MMMNDRYIVVIIVLRNFPFLPRKINPIILVANVALQKKETRYGRHQYFWLCF